MPALELSEKSSPSSPLSSSSSSSLSRSSCSTPDMNSRNIEPKHEDLDLRIKRNFGHLMDDQDDTSGQTTPERDATNHMEFPPKQSNGRLPANIRTYEPTGYDRPRRS